jgi:hypothetical protein
VCCTICCAVQLIYSRPPPSLWRMPPQANTDYARRTICFAFSEGRCDRQTCVFSHTLVDPVRVLQLVGDAQITNSLLRSGRDHEYLCIECSRYGGVTDIGTWTVRLLDGGRATLSGTGWNISVQPTYPKESQASSCLQALKDLETKVFGRVSPVRINYYH